VRGLKELLGFKNAPPPKSDFTTFKADYFIFVIQLVRSQEKALLIRTIYGNIGSRDECTFQ
jgi:hypothetical protein